MLVRVGLTILAVAVIFFVGWGIGAMCEMLRKSHKR
jgi:hypothetical protein